MKRLGIYLLFVVYILYSCAGTKKVYKINNSVDETKLMEYEYVFIEATKQKLLGNFNTALSMYNACIKANGNSAVSFYEVSTIYSRMGKMELGIEYAERAVKLDTENNWYKKHLAQMYYSNGLIENTIQIYEKIIKENPENIEYLFSVSNLYKENKDYKNALKYLNEVENIIGINEETSLAKENIYLNLDKIDLAYLELERLVNKYPDNPKYYGILAELYAQNGLNDKASLMYERIFKLDKNNSVAQLSYSEFLRKNGNYEKCFEVLAEAVDNIDTKLDTKVYTLMSYILNDKEFTIYSTKLESLIQKLRFNYSDTINVGALYADFLIRNNELVKARLQLKRLIDSNSNIEYFWEKLVFINGNMEEYDSMYYDSEKAIKLFPDNSIFYYLNGIAAIQLKKYKEALVSLKNGITLISDNDQLTIQFYISFADAYNGIKEYENSDKYYEKVLQLDAENNLVLNNYSYYLSLREDKLGKAEKMIVNCITNEPENSTYLDTYAWILYKLGRYDEAKLVIEKALRFGGEISEEIIEHYGDILFVTGDEKLAVEYWKKAKEMGRDTDELKNKILLRKLISD